MKRHPLTGKYFTPALAVLLLAACARTEGPGHAYQKAAARQQKYFYLDPLTPLFSRERGPDGSWFFTARRAMSPPHPRFSARKPPGVKRVFVLGGSVVQLFDEEALKAALEAAGPGERYEIIDCGLSAYDSRRDALILREVLNYQPDLIVLMSGVNEGERIGPAVPHRGRWLLRMTLRGLLLRHPVLAYRLARSAVEPTPPPARIAADFAANVRSMIRRAKARKVPIVLTALPWNLRDMPPRGALPLKDRRFFDAWLAFEEEDYAAAEKLFRQALPAFAKDPALSKELIFAKYYLARALDKRGRHAAARDAYQAALELAVPPMPAINRALKRLSDEEDVPLADLAEAFARVSPHGLTGSDLFEDDMHWDRFLDPLVAEVIVRALRPERPYPDFMRYRALAKKAAARNEKAWIVFRFRAWGAGLGGGGLSERIVALMDVVHAAHPELLANILELKQWLRGKLAGNIWDSEAAANLDSWWPVMLGHIGESYLRRGQSLRALGYFAEALRLNPKLTAVRLRRAAALARSGRKKEAALALDLLAREHGDMPEIGYYRAALPGIKTRKGKPAAKPSAKMPALALEGSRFLGAHQQLMADASGAARQGDDARALDLLQRLEKMEPAAELRLEMARLYLNLRQGDAARHAVDRAMSSPLDYERTIRAARLYGDMKEHVRAAAAWKRAAESAPADAEPWFQQARHLEEARVFIELPAVLERAAVLAKQPQRRLRAAEKLADLGKEELALKFADQVRDAAPEADLRMRVGWLYQRLRKYPRCVSVFSRLTRNPKFAAAARRDKGVCEYLNGAPEQAVKDLEAALALEPELLSAYLSAGTILESLKRPQDALDLYERGLKIPAKKDHEELRRKLTESRDRVRGASIR
ncbi:MAG: tetratricopeptide repeat protein [Elusimicrobiota bacterium]